MSPTQMVLARLEGVRHHGDGWTARCPAHQDRTASLTIAEGDDGKALLCCFAGCHITSIATAIGLSLRDLFPRPPESVTAAELADRQAHARMASWRGALAVLAAEVAVVEIAAAEGRTLSPEDVGRLALAAERIARCRAVLVPTAYRPPREVAA